MDHLLRGRMLKGLKWLQRRKVRTLLVENLDAIQPRLISGNQPVTSDLVEQHVRIWNDLLLLLQAWIEQSLSVLPLRVGILLPKLDIVRELGDKVLCVTPPKIERLERLESAFKKPGAACREILTLWNTCMWRRSVDVWLHIDVHFWFLRLDQIHVRMTSFRIQGKTHGHSRRSRNFCPSFVYDSEKKCLMSLIELSLTSSRSSSILTISMSASPTLLSGGLVLRRFLGSVILGLVCACQVGTQRGSAIPLVAARLLGLAIPSQTLDTEIHLAPHLGPPRRWPWACASLQGGKARLPPRC